MKRTVCAILLGALIVSSFGACSNNNSSDQSKDDKSTSSVSTVSSESSGDTDSGANSSSDAESSDSVSLKDMKSVSEAFVEALRVKDYDKAFSYVYKPEGSCLTLDGFKWAVSRSKYSDDLAKSKDGMRYKSSTENQSGYTARTMVKFFLDYDYLGETPVNLISDSDDNWYIDAGAALEGYELGMKDWSMYAPVGVDISINNTKIDSKFKTATEVGNYSLMDQYCIPYVDIKPFTVSYKCKNFEFDSKDVVPDDNTDREPQLVFAGVDDEIYKKSLSSVKTMFNEVTAKYFDGKDKSSISNWMDSDSSINEVWELLPHLEYQRGLSGRNYDCDMTQCKQDGDNLPYWISSDSLVVPFRYEMKWYYDGANKGNKSMHKSCTLLLRYKDGKFTYITDLSGTKMFGWASEFTNEW